ncbi:MAG: hypothetical protein KC549_01280 [Myxococcales bacterium]|nr:hypothetical protein [Myxococcales bacterium]MCB9547978.1 hypothetical protein [Myxococcales bacterium]
MRLLKGLVVSCAAVFGATACDDPQYVSCPRLERLSWVALDSELADSYPEGVAAAVAGLSGDYCLRLQPTSDESTRYEKLSVEVVPLVGRVVYIAHRSNNAVCGSIRVPVRVFAGFGEGSEVSYLGPVAYVGPYEGMPSFLNQVPEEASLRPGYGEGSVDVCIRVWTPAGQRLVCIGAEEYLNRERGVRRLGQGESCGGTVAGSSDDDAADTRSDGGGGR